MLHGVNKTHGSMAGRTPLPSVLQIRIDPLKRGNRLNTVGVQVGAKV